MRYYYLNLGFLFVLLKLGYNYKQNLIFLEFLIIMSFPKAALHSVKGMPHEAFILAPKYLKISFFKE